MWLRHSFLVVIFLSLSAPAFGQEVVPDPTLANQDATLARARNRAFDKLEQTIKRARVTFDKRNLALLEKAKRANKEFCAGSVLDLNKDGGINIQDKAFSINLIQSCGRFGTDRAGSAACILLDENGDGIVNNTDSSVAWEFTDNYDASSCHHVTQ